MEHTPKNLLIRAVRTGKRSDQGKVEKMLAALNIHPTLDRLLNEKEQEAVFSEEQTRRKEADSLKNYLQKNLSKTQYTYLFNQNGVLEIGVPSAKYISRAKELCTKYTEQTKQDVTVCYELCRYSIKELEKAKESLEKDKDFTQLMKQVRYALVINNGYLELYCTDETPKKFDSWFEKSDYRDMVVVNEYQKILPTDSVGL